MPAVSAARPPPRFRNIRISDIEVEKAGKGIRIFGWEDAPIGNVFLRNVIIEEVESNRSEDHFLISQGVEAQDGY